MIRWAGSPDKRANICPIPATLRLLRACSNCLEPIRSQGSVMPDLLTLSKSMQPTLAALPDSIVKVPAEHIERTNRVSLGVALNVGAWTSGSITLIRVKKRRMHTFWRLVRLFQVAD